MKKIVTFLMVAFIAINSIAQEIDALSGATQITVTTGAGYTDEVYWGFEEYNHTVSRSAWDIAFTTDQMDVSILANNGNEVQLYTYPNGTIDDWANVDTTGITWKAMYNSLDSWNYGAFLDNQTPGQFDYGWGTYNMSTHNIIGDSIFIIKIAEEDYRKLAIIQKNAVENQWTFKYANLDGTNEQEITFDADDYSTMNFVHYSITNEEFVSHEPNSDSWDILFTRYYDYTIPYYVSGILSKAGVAVQEVSMAGLDQESYNTYDTTQFSEVINTIGSDWKEFNIGTFSYDLSDSTVFFVKELPDGDVWKIYFTDFGGSGTGEYTFMQEKLTSYNGIHETNQSFATVYPNPAINNIQIIHEINGQVQIGIYDLSGKLLQETTSNQNQGLNKCVINIETLPSGIYHAVIEGNSEYSTVKFVKK